MVVSTTLSYEPPALKAYSEGSDLRLDMEDALVRLIVEKGVVPHYQPVVDLFFAEVLSYEVLSRANAPFHNTALLFDCAEQHGMLWELEALCREKAYGDIARLPRHLRARHFFINISPTVFMDPRFGGEYPVNELRSVGIDHRQLVFEITESAGIPDYMEFERLARQAVNQGFMLAIDDFGAGHSSMITLMAASPHFIKLDRALVSDIDRDSYKQHLVKAIVSFVSSVESKLVAEGVERIEELETLLRLGVRYAQGYLLARPAPEPPELAPEIREAVLALTRKLHYPRVSLSTPLSSMILRPPAFPLRTMTAEELDVFFRHNPHADHVIVQDGNKPVALVTRRHFADHASGPYGYQLIKRKFIEDAVARRDPLTVRQGMDITVLGRLAMERDQEELYDPVVVVDENGDLLGTLTMKALLTESIRLEVKLAASASPLTGLPGNTMIQSWLQDALQADAWTIVYADLDHFKEFNDAYGFPQGDHMIKLAAEILGDLTPAMGCDARLGHVGGDDFVIVTKGTIDTDVLREACDQFDEAKKALFSSKDVLRGYYEATNRQGQLERVNMVTISMAVVSSLNVGPNPYPGQLGQIASDLKKKIKAENDKTGESGFWVDARHHQ